VGLIRRFLLCATLTALATLPSHADNEPEASPAVDVVESFVGQTANLRPEILRLALEAYERAQTLGVVHRPVLTVIDYELPSYEKRLWVLDLEDGEVLFEEWVAHGMGRPPGTGGDMERARSFSNTRGSLKSSLGLYRTAETYIGKHGYSLRLDGLEPGVNDAARGRYIVMHSAHYVSSTRAEKRRVGRSWGCPVVRRQVSRRLIEAVKDGSALWIFFPDDEWLQHSPFLGTAQEDVAKGAPEHTNGNGPTTGTRATRQ